MSYGRPEYQASLWVAGIPLVIDDPVVAGRRCLARAGALQISGGHRRRLTTTFITQDGTGAGVTLEQDHLGPGYTCRQLSLRGNALATLVHHPAARNTRGAVLYVHGFVDYFFQTHVAEHFTGRGFDFYAIDLRRYGRSLRPDDVPYFIDDLTTYDEELDLAVEQIRADGHERLVVLAHSTGGLIAPLWLHDRRDAGQVDALLLNSPWLELAEGWFRRTVVTRAIDVFGKIRPMALLPEKLGVVYPESIHTNHHGEWDFNTDWKPVAGVPLHAGWLRAIRRGHARLHRGLDVRVPVLVMHSDTSLLHQRAWSPAAMSADTVLDVAQMEHWAPSIGPNVTTATIPNGMHDLFLSGKPVRERAFEVLDAWLDRVVREGT
jgi:alpha-beta hydrolase superfamily lysophospholipase